jgi:hypothetical protein
MSDQPRPTDEEHEQTPEMQEDAKEQRGPAPADSDPPDETEVDDA